MWNLELARGFTYTLHISPTRDGAHVLIPIALKGPPTSFLECLDTSVASVDQRLGFSSTLVNFRGRMLSSCPSSPPGESP
jgi:hypothetical protein